MSATVPHRTLPNPSRERATHAGVHQVNESDPPTTVGRESEWLSTARSTAYPGLGRKCLRRDAKPPTSEPGAQAGEGRGSDVADSDRPPHGPDPARVTTPTPWYSDRAADDGPRRRCVAFGGLSFLLPLCAESGSDVAVTRIGVEEPRSAVRDRRRRPAFVVVRASRRGLHGPCSARKGRRSLPAMSIFDRRTPSSKSRVMK
jgi:hypothetical protein